MPYPDDLQGFELGYIVGLLEGEGSIIFSKTRRKNRKWYLLTQVTISNCNRALLEKFHEICGCGTIRFHCKSTEKHRANWNFTINRKDEIYWILKQTYPYLIEKKKRAEQMIHWLDVRGQRKYSNYRYTEAEIELFEKYWSTRFDYDEELKNALSH